MPIAAALGVDNQENQVNVVPEETARDWERMKNIGIPGPKFLPSDLIYMGVRDTEDPENQVVKKLGLRNYMVHDVRYRGLDTVMDEVIDTLYDCDILYISFDVDSLDCDLVSQGTGTPAPKGFDPEEVRQIIDRLLKTNKVVCLEITEVNPLLDDGNTMAETAFWVLNEITKTITKANAT